jgi:hypothetical protein
LVMVWGVLMVAPLVYASSYFQPFFSASSMLST